MKLLLLLLVLIAAVFSGRILSGDVKVDYANAGSMTQLSFSFMLSNSITPQDYLLVALPFPFHSELIPAFPAMEGLSSPLSLLVTYQHMDNYNNVLSTVYFARVLTDTIDSSNYYLQFYATDRKTVISIPADQWFYLTFKIQNSASLAYQTSNSVLQIQLSTVSSVWPNAMVYDDNLAFNYFQLAATPSQLITLAATPYNFGSSGGYLLTQQAYSIYLDVTLSLPTYYYNTNLVLKFLISQDKSFLFNNTCSSVAKTNAPRINALASSLFTCTVDTVNNIMSVVLTPAALAIQQSFRFTVDIINPSTIAQAVSINVNAVQQHCSIIIGYGTANGVLNTNQLYVTYQEIFLGWGLRPDALLPFDARIYRGSSATPNYMPYNSLTLKFSLSRSTSATVELKVVISIPSESSAFVLPSSYSTNLPAFPNKQVVCVTQYSTSTTNRQIACTGVGALTVGTVYYVGWKMFFPYDNYQSSINCSQFGLLTIYTTTTIDSTNYAYYLGRGDDFLNYLKTSSNFVVIGRNATYINYVTTFPSVNLVVRSLDFQEFLQQPETHYINNRPPSYANKNFNDVFVITQNLAFLTYINLFTDIYCAVLIPQNTDIVNGYGTIPLVATTTPKNTLSITTSNSQDWSDFVTNTNPLVSSVASASTNTPGISLVQNPTTAQSLVFSWKAPYTSVTSFSSTSATTITNGWGIMIMMNPSIEFDATTTSGVIQSTQPSSNSLTVSYSSVTSASAYNKYTMIQLTGTISDHLQNIFQTTATKTAFGVYPFKVKNYASLYSDNNCMDFMIATVDGINGPQNRMTYNGYFLINGFTQTPATGTLNMGFINYQSSTPMDGSTVPTLLRIKGTITNNQTQLDSLIVFFDSLTPFFSNKESGEIHCYNTDNTNPCRYSQGPLSLTTNQKYNYLTLSRFEIPLVTPGTAFNVMIPVTFAGAQTITNFYIGYQVVNSSTGFKSLAYVQPSTSISISYTASVSGSFGPTVTARTVGETFTNLQLRATSPVTLTVNSGNNIGSAFSYFSQWDYFGSSTVTGFQTYGTCAMMTYLYYITNYKAYLTGSTFSYSYKSMKGIVCNCDTGGSITGLYLTISQGYIPSKWGKSIPGNGAISDNTGRLLYRNSNYQTVGITPTATGITFPAVGPNMARAVGAFSIPLPVPLDQNSQITITGNPGTTNLPFTFTGTCAVYYNGVKTATGCNFVAVPTQVTYTLTILESGLIPAGSGFSIVHYGLTSNSSYNSINVDINCFSLMTTSTPGANQLIFSATAIQFPYNSASYIGPSSLSLGSFTQWTNSKAVVESFNFTFTLLSKGLYVTNRVRFNLGQFATDNSDSSVTPRCKVYTYSTTGSNDYSHDWAAVDSSGGLTNLQLWPSSNLINNNLTYTIKCINFLSTSSPTPISITAKIANTTADLTGELSSSSSISLPVLTSMSSTCQVTLSKSFSIPSIGMEMNFNIISSGVTPDSFFYLNFPYYYSNGLGQDIKCYSPNGEIYCTIVDRFVTIQYIGTYTSGTSFTITITGVTMAINYNSGTFSYILDNDNNPNSVVAAGTFVDSISSSVLSIQNFPTINIFSFTQSSAYLRESGLSISLTFYLPTSLTSIGLGQSLFLVFPAHYYDVLRFVTPTCTLNLLGNTLKNYLSTCSVRGMRIKMPFLDNLVLGSIYNLTISGIINPTNPSSNSYRYSLELTDSTGTSIIAKSYALNCNYVMPIFIWNAITSTLNYYKADGTLVTKVDTIANIQSDNIYIAPLLTGGLTVPTSIYSRNTYLSPLSSLLSTPSTINLLAGANPFPIRLSSVSSGVNYLYFSKTGDGGFYSNLPPLILTTDKNYFTSVSFVQTGFKLPVNVVGTNYNLIVTLPSSLHPMSQVSFIVTLSSSVGISMKTNPTVISFYPQNNVANIALFINDATQWVVGATTNLVFTPAATTTTYASGTTVPLQAVAAPGVPTATMTATTLAVNSLAYTVQCTEQGKFIYHLSRSFSYNLSACNMTATSIKSWLLQSSLNGLRVSQSYYKCDDVISAINVNANVAKVLALSNLQSSTAYSLQGFCQTQDGVQSTLLETISSTTSNGGIVSSMVFTFSSSLTTAQKIKLVCALALYFQMDYTKVSTWDGYYCSELLNRRRLQEVTGISDSLVSKAHERLLTTPTYSIVVYYGINTETTSDTTQTAINTAAATPATLVNMLNSNVTGLPTILSAGANTASYVGTNNIQGTFYLGTGPNFVYIYNLRLQNDGLVYIIIGSNSVWTRAPVVAEIKTGSGPNGLPPVFFRVLPYRTSDPSSGNMAWNGLSSGSYTMYVVASDSNPFDNANFGPITSYPITAEVPSWEQYIIAGVMTLLLLIVL